MRPTSELLGALQTAIYWNPPILGVTGETELILRRCGPASPALEDLFVDIVDAFWSQPATLAGFLTALGTEYTGRATDNWPYQLVVRGLLHINPDVRMAAVLTLGHWRTEKSRVCLEEYLEARREPDPTIIAAACRIVQGI